MGEREDAPWLDELEAAAIPTFRFTDTGWLVTLAQLAWDRAVVVD